jgi:hypothetical protein
VTELDEEVDLSRPPRLYLGTTWILGHAEMTSMSIDTIVKQVTLTFDTLETIIVPSSTTGTPNDGFYALGETTDLFKVWLSNTTVARENCTSYEDCLRNNPELRLTIAELLGDIKDDLAEGKCDLRFRWGITAIDTAQAAQHIAQHDPSNVSSPDDVEVYRLDTPSTLSLGGILVDVNSAIACLMRLSRPLLDNHQRHPTIDRYCTEDDTHHAQGLRRLLPRADWIALEQISKSTCARRSELLAMNSRRLESPGPAPKPLNDDAYLRVILLEMASVTGEATIRDSDASSSIEAAQELEGDRTAFIDSEVVKAPVARRLGTKNTKQVDIVLSIPQNLPRP